MPAVKPGLPRTSLSCVVSTLYSHTGIVIASPGAVPAPDCEERSFTFFSGFPSRNLCSSIEQKHVSVCSRVFWSHQLEPAALSSSRTGTAQVSVPPADGPLPFSTDLTLVPPARSESHLSPSKRAAADEHGQADSESDGDSEAELPSVIEIPACSLSLPTAPRVSPVATSRSPEAGRGDGKTGGTLPGSLAPAGPNRKREVQLMRASKSPRGHYDACQGCGEGCSFSCSPAVDASTRKAATVPTQEDAELQDLIERNEENLKVGAGLPLSLLAVLLGSRPALPAFGCITSS